MSIETKLFISHGFRVEVVKDLRDKNKPSVYFAFTDGGGTQHMVEMGWLEKGKMKKLTPERCEILYKKANQSGVDFSVGKILSLYPQAATNVTLH